MQPAELEDLALSLIMSVFVESHDAGELDRALKKTFYNSLFSLETPCAACGAWDALKLKTLLIGINNRKLRSFEVSLDTTLAQLSIIPDDRIVVTESGILTPADVALMRHGVHAFLVGETFMRAPSPSAELARLFGF